MELLGQHLTVVFVIILVKNHLVFFGEASFHILVGKTTSHGLGIHRHLGWSHWHLCFLVPLQRLVFVGFHFFEPLLVELLKFSFSLFKFEFFFGFKNDLTEAFSFMHVLLKKLDVLSALLADICF